MLRIISNNRNAIDNHPEYVYKSIVFIRKVAKTVKGGKNISFYTIAIVGNKKGTVGIGSGKARSISDAIDKSLSNAVKHVIKINKIYDMNYRYCASEIILRTKLNTITKAPSYITEIFEALGINNISCKIIGSKNIVNNIFCTFNALKESIKINTMLNLRKRYLSTDKKDVNQN